MEIVKFRKVNVKVLVTIFLIPYGTLKMNISGSSL